MNYDQSIVEELERIKVTRIIPPEIESVLADAIQIREKIENSFSESEKENIIYLRVKSTIDSHIGAIISHFPKK
ncbi:MAG TPA: hypothetical protein VNB22_04495 [Pyrinomonadaceae bacterium]|nr:hypothetical protein [Pyrinomonadaceae bacterium]